MPAKKHRVKLTEEERSYLIDLTTKGASSARKQTRARILLKVDEGPQGQAWADAPVSEALDVCPATVARARRLYCTEGLERAISRKSPDRDYERKIDGEAEAELVRLSCSEAPEGRSHWSLRLLADEMVELGYFEQLSHETVRQVLKKTN
jgi:hypothetical protein